MSTTPLSTVSSERPKTLQWAKAAAIFQIFVGIGVIYLLLWLVDAESVNPFLQGVKNGFMQELAKQGVMTYDYTLAGKASFEPLLGILASIILLVGLRHRTATMYKVVIGFLLLHFISGLAHWDLLVLTPILLGLCFTASARAYWNTPSEPDQTSVTPPPSVKPVPAVKSAPKKSVKTTPSSKATPKKKAATAKKKSA